MVNVRRSEMSGFNQPVESGRIEVLTLEKQGPANVGAHAFTLPSKAISTRPMVPLPDRFGPTSRKIFCCRVSGVRQ